MTPASVSFTRRKRLFLVSAALVFSVMLLFNCLTPYLADDFTFAYAFDTGERLHSLPQLLSSLSFHYREWSGRVVVKFFAQAFTMFPKMLFNLCNAAAYLGLGLVIYRLARGRRSGRYDVLAFALIEAALWEISPAFGQTNLWMCGSCNYLWASLGCLAYLLPWRYYLQAPFAGGAKLAVAMALGGVFTGWLSENTSAGVLVCIVLCIGFMIQQKQKVPLWMWTGFAGTLAGFALLVLAPGNYNRTEMSADSTLPFLTRYAVRFFRCSNMLTNYALPLLLGFAVLYVLLCYQKPGPAGLFWPAALLLSGLGANYAMVLSPQYYERSSHGVFALLTAACIACLVQLKGTGLRRVLTAVAACVCVVGSFHLCDAGYDIACYYTMYRTREAEIVAAAEAQEIPYSLVVESYGIEPYTRWCAAYGLPDIRENAEDSIALGRAKWYGLNRLYATESRTYLFEGHTNSTYESGLETAETE